MASKASANFPSFMTGYYGPSSSSSRDFQSLVRAIGEAKSKHEEDRIAKRELALLKDKLTQRDTSPKQMREYLVRLIYCEMLGHDASIGYVEAIKFAQQSNNLDKRVGYLAASLFLHEDHELIVLLINTLQKDLRSTNVIEVCCALTVVCKLINKEMMPALLPQVIELLQCKRDIVRKKAVMALQSFYLKNPSAIPDVRGHAKKAIRDKDPGVMSASLHVFHELIKANPAKYKDLVPAFVSLQNMIIGGQLASDYDFHGVAAPWVQIKVLKILGLLGVDDEKSSKAMYPILGKTLSNLNTSSLIGYAVAYEGLRTITSIYPDRSLIQKAGRCVHVFLVAKTNDIKYLGINILTSLLQAGSGFVMEPTYQRIVIDCLDDPDETLKRKTLDLLCHITNAENVDKVCEKLLSYLKSTTDADVYFRTELVDRITELAERYAPDNSWYILTMNEVFELGGSLVRDAVAHNMMRLLAEGTDDENEDNEIRRFAVMSYINLLEKPVLPDILIRVNSWVLGEYSYTASEYDPEYFLEELLSLLERKFEDPSTKAWVISAIGKLTSQMGHLQDSTRDVLERHATGVDVELRQRCSEIQELSQNTFLMQSVLPVDGCCEDLEVDESLSFLDGLVAEALSSGAHPYTPISERNTEKNTKEVSDVQPALKFTPYENPIKKPREPTPQPDSTYDEKEKRSKDLKTSTDVDPKAKSRTKTRTIEETPSSKTLFSGQAVWGPGGYAKDRARSGSVDSNSKSDSSSRSTGSENTAVKTNAEASTSSPVTNQDDVRKQHLAAQLFSGVTVKPRSSAGRGHLGSNKMSRHAGKTKADAAGMPSIDDSSHSLQRLNFKAADKTNTDLLCDLGSNEVRDNEEEQARFKTHALLSSLDMVGSRDSNNSNIQELFADSKPPLPVPTSHADSRLSVSISHADPGLPVPTSHADPRQSVLTSHTDPRLYVPTSDADPRLSVQTSHDDPHLSVPTSQANPSYETTEQKTTLLDEEITDPLQCLELTGSPSASLPKDLAEFPHSPEALELYFDSNLRVTFQKVWKPSELVLVIYLTNQNQANTPIHDVTCVFEPPSNLIGSFDSSSSNTLQDENIGGLEWVRHQIVLKYKSPALHMNFGGKISYKDPNRTLKHLFFNHTLSISDLLRPLVISTEEFGQKWTDASFEKKQKLSSSLKSCQEFSKRTEDCLKLYPVEIIGTKVILAGTVMQSGICLLHASCDGDVLELSIKSNNRLLNDAVLKHCGTVFR